MCLPFSLVAAAPRKKASVHLWGSVTATASSHHLIILLQDHIFIVIKVQQIDGKEFIWDAAGTAHILAEFQCIDDGLDGGVIGGPHVLPQWEGAGPPAVIGIVPTGRDNPTSPANFLKVHREWLSVAR